QLLDGAQVGAALQQMRGERVAQRVRAHPPGDAGRARRAPDDRVNGAHGEPPAAGIREQRAPALTALAEPILERAKRRTAVGHDALLAALAEYAHGTLAAVHVVEIEAGQLGDAQTTGVE